VVLKPDENAESKICELHLELCNALPLHVREAWIQNMAKHSTDEKAAFLHRASNDFTAAQREVFLPHLTVAQKETQAEAEALVQQCAASGGSEIEVPLDVVLLRRDVDNTPMCLEYVFREGRMVHACEMYVPEAVEGEMLSLRKATEPPTPAAVVTTLNPDSSCNTVCICCKGTGVVIAIGICPLCDGSKAFSTHD
jgi:hypothetical protein